MNKDVLTHGIVMQLSCSWFSAQRATHLHIFSHKDSFLDDLIPKSTFIQFQRVALVVSSMIVHSIISDF